MASESRTRLDGKTVVITGGNTGIGKETAIDLAARGAKVYIACRDAKRGSDAVSEIRLASGSTEVYTKILDLASHESIRAFVSDFLRESDKLHILINNAGVFCSQRTETVDGLETTFGVNHVGHFLLTNLLLDRIKASAPSRIINVSSHAHKSASAMNFEDLNSVKSFKTFAVYAQSKLANIYFTKKLHELLTGHNVSVYSLHPGLVKTELSRDLPTFYRLLFAPILFAFAKTPKQGAQTTIYCACQPGLEKESGSYFADCRVAATNAAATDTQAANRLWDISMQLCGL